MLDDNTGRVVSQSHGWVGGEKGGTGEGEMVAAKREGRFMARKIIVMENQRQVFKEEQAHVTSPSDSICR